MAVVVTLTPISNKQWLKVLKALIYSFVSAFLGVFTVSKFAITKTVLTAAIAAGINAVLVAVWQLFQQDNPNLASLVQPTATELMAQLPPTIGDGVVSSPPQQS